MALTLPEIARPAAVGPAYRIAHDLPGVLMSVCGSVANGVPKTDNRTRNGKHTKVCQRRVRTYPAFDGSCFPIHIRLQSFPRRERPRCRRTAEQRDELAAPCMSGKEHCEGCAQHHSTP